MALVQWILSGPLDSNVEENWVKVDGHSVHYLKTGSGPDLILIHGLLGTASAWSHSLPALGHESTVYAVDSLGVGRSERVRGLDASLSASADRLASFMDTLQIQSADLVGTSHGGAVALTFAARYPHRVRSLVLHAPANPFSNIADPLIRFYRTRLGRWFAHQLPTLPRTMQSLALGRMYGDPAQVREGALENYVSSLTVPGTVEHVLRILRGWSADMNQLAHTLKTTPLSQPVLLLWGTRDRAVSLESGYALAKILGDAEMVILPGAGHLPFEEDPPMFTKPVNRFLSRLDRGSRSPRPRGPVLIERKPPGK
jgi:pimeloyl-ACP methyl ester carboxylesterase